MSGRKARAPFFELPLVGGAFLPENAQNSLLETANAIPLKAYFCVLGMKTWRPRYMPQCGQAWCESRGFLQFGHVTSCGRSRWWCARRSPWRARETRCFGNAPIEINSSIYARGRA